ncbi:hypothetical protein [Allokutzneria albata]|uniref:Uncharacterized protein n=1 Tax=Allokutzneria albata TaxID=211114 RepID=A0A1G9WMR2_ALLAB|nr:hypothetical protein [Allokutzneria albata]SDM85471.1 hypothetical protein SAMN04489726_3687 [Allokutzneria albata]
MTWIALGALGILGLLWTVRPRRRELVLNSWLTVTASAVTDLAGAETASVAGVSRARARLRGSASKPALKLTLWLTADADPARVRRTVEADVLAGVRSALGVTNLPTTLHLRTPRRERTE